MILPPKPKMVETCSNIINAKFKVKKAARKLLAEFNVKHITDDEVNSKGEVADGNSNVKFIPGSLSCDGHCDIFQVSMSVCGVYQLTVFEEVQSGSLRCLVVYIITRTNDVQKVRSWSLDDWGRGMYF